MSVTTTGPPVASTPPLRTERGVIETLHAGGGPPADFDGCDCCMSKQKAAAAATTVVLPVAAWSAGTLEQVRTLRNSFTCSWGEAVERVQSRRDAHGSTLDELLRRHAAGVDWNAAIDVMSGQS